jgi:single-stranded DNA-specific DHH superfamily exonuclease
MIPEEKLEEFKNILSKAKNPIFLYDDDPDGLASFLVLRKWVGKGLGIRASHVANKNSYALIEKIRYENPDVIVFLDMAVVEQGFIDAMPCTILHLDHHPPQRCIGSHYNYYNPRVYDTDSQKPTSYWAYKIAGENLWIAMVGIIADWYVPEFVNKFREQYPGYIQDVIPTPGHAYFDSKIGLLGKFFMFAMKGSKSEINKCVNTLIEIEKPEEILEQTTEKGQVVFNHAMKQKVSYDEILAEALEQHKNLHDNDDKDPIFIYTYGTKENSFSSLLATELIHRINDKIIIVARVKEGETIMSLRSRSVSIPEKLSAALQGLHGRGGGHPLACGAGISNADYPLFLERFKAMVLEELEKGQ